MSRQLRVDGVAALAGVLFGLGLALSGMTRPEKVTGFLDFTGAWDASLAFVMMGAIGVHAVAYRLIRRRAAPLFDSRFHVPSRKDLDVRLIGGAALFGVGWGLGGLCPGPALLGAGAGGTTALVFVVGMTMGLLLARAARPRDAHDAPSADLG